MAIGVAQGSNIVAASSVYAIDDVGGLEVITFTEGILCEETVSGALQGFWNSSCICCLITLGGKEIDRKEISACYQNQSFY